MFVEVYIKVFEGFKEKNPCLFVGKFVVWAGFGIKLVMRPDPDSKYLIYFIYSA